MRPELFRIGGQPFYTYGFMLGLALFLAWEMGAWLAEKDGIERKKTFRFAIVVIAAGYVGGHLHSWATDPGTRLLSGTGFTFYASALSGALAALPACLWLKIDYLRMADATAPSIALAHGIGRIGCFLRGCCFGVPSEHGIAFPKDSPAWEAHVRAGWIPASAPWSRPVVPTQLIESGYELLLTGALVLLVLRRPRLGTAGLVYLAAYGPLRIIVERYRADPDRGEILGLSTSTFIGLVTCVLAALLLAPPLSRWRAHRNGGAPRSGGIDSPAERTTS
jgi:phosphatidylglycerol:prolipoprotein diacylglycerol transferase